MNHSNVPLLTFADGNDPVHGPDKFIFSINGHDVDLGYFSQNVDEGRRSGRTSDGISFFMNSLTKPRRMSFSHGKDQKHRIVANVPRYIFGGNLKLALQFKPMLSSKKLMPRIQDESAGFDNIKVIAKVCQSVRMPPPTRRIAPSPPPRVQSDPEEILNSELTLLKIPNKNKPGFVNDNEGEGFENSFENFLSTRLTEEINTEFGGRGRCLYRKGTKVWVNLIEVSEEESQQQCNR